MSGRREDWSTRDEYQVEAQEQTDWEHHLAGYACPRSPEEIALLFDQIKNDSQEFRSEYENQMAQEALQAISQRLSSRYGHESPIDWHDHPQAALLTIGENAARRITRYHGQHVETNERVRDWNQAMTAYAFSLNIDESNAAWRAIRQHGAYESRPIFTPGE